VPGRRTARARRRAARAGGRSCWARGFGRTRRTCRARGFGWTRRTCWARRSRWAGRRFSARGCGSKARAFATPVGYVLRVLLERRRATVPRRKVGACVEQIAGNQDLLFGGVGQTFHRLTRRHRWIGMSRDPYDGRHQHGAERPSETVICHEPSFAVDSLSRSTVFCAKKPCRLAPSPASVRAWPRGLGPVVVLPWLIEPAHAALAQLVEHRSCKARVESSSLSRGSTLVGPRAARVSAQSSWSGVSCSMIR
jgi:hypothetical protein